MQCAPHPTPSASLHGSANCTCVSPHRRFSPTPLCRIIGPDRHINAPAWLLRTGPACLIPLTRSDARQQPTIPPHAPRPCSTRPDVVLIALFVVAVRFNSNPRQSEVKRESNRHSTLAPSSLAYCTDVRLRRRHR
ncbi:uncharacterized protein EI97DRAFT_9300 [Westerdykella ornata]|uniref:Uncharacterized protein n=1 Tax=Westerdykella ornata TaxID=318751 RepID=A0A6A6JW37_WESOR|nr:uncharacterized protein EI97DRAFT_9300 [Westerdykella ornata]KAF2280830.1 hypothetical protein EI97DRAFT_9300 [Westerdykella ornata]